MGAIYNILAFPFFLIRKCQNTKFIWWKTHGLLNTVGKIALWGVDEVVTAGNKSFNAKTTKVRVIGHAIDTNFFSYVERVKENSCLKILTVGRIVPIKKIEIALQTISLLKEKETFNVLISLYGPVTELHYKEILVDQIKKDRIEPLVTFFGSQTPERMCSIYPQYDILMHPAYEAGFDKVVLEAMAMGVVPITSIKSFQPILEPFGLYVMPNDLNQYAKTVVSILNMTHCDRQELRKKLRNIVIESHSIETLPERIFGVV